MAPPGELNLLKEPQLKDKDKESYNGYITTTVASLDRPLRNALVLSTAARLDLHKVGHAGLAVFTH